VGGSKKQQTTQTYTPPTWVSNASQQAIGIGSRIGRKEWEGYKGERVAGLSENEQLGIRMAKDTGVGQPMYNKADVYTERGAQQFRDANIDEYMNPFIKGALDPAAREIREEGAREGNRLDAMSASMDAFGGSRAALMRSENRERTIQGISDLYGRGFAMAYESAVGIWGDERARDMQAAGRFMEIGDAMERAQETDISTLMATGATDRGIQQAMADFDFMQFMEERDWDWRQLGGIIAALEGTKGSYGTTTTAETEQKSNGAAAILGIIGAVIGGIYGGGQGASTGASIGMAVGGELD